MDQAPRTETIGKPKGRRALWIAFLALLGPLVVLLALQYGWLVDLERNSAIARQAKLGNLLGRITKDVRAFYTHRAEKTLSFEATLLEPEYVQKIGKIFRKRKVEGVSRFFVVSFLDKHVQYLLYDPKTHEMTRSETFSPEIRAIAMAVAPWTVLRKKGGPIEATGLLAEERDPDHRMILKPITDEDSNLAGLAGMIIDQEYFRNHVLSRVVEESLGGSPDDEIIVMVHDARGQPFWPADAHGTPEARPLTAGEKENIRPLSFLFTDMKIALWGRTSTPQQWARSNFALNATLSLILAAVLLGALALILRTTAREMHLSEMKNDFVSNVSHELRTPLASIRVFGEFLRLGRVSSPEKVREYGEYIETESRRLTQLINNILDFSRIESGSWAYQLESADLGEIVVDVLKTFEIRLRRSGFQIDLNPPASPLPEMRLDRDAIRQALFNLLDNAVKYSGENRNIEVRLHRRGAKAIVEVRDHGIGISRRERKKIFERFHRVGTGPVHDVKGSGLGLAIVDHIVRAHGGEVRLDSEPGVGSTFSLHLPIALTKTSSSTEPALPSVREGDPRLQQFG